LAYNSLVAEELEHDVAGGTNNGGQLGMWEHEHGCG